MFTTLADQGLNDPELARLKVDMVREGTSLLRLLVAEAVERGELAAGVDADDAVTLLTGPLVMRQFFEDGPVTPELIGSSVDQFLLAAAPARVGSAGARSGR